jgi:preprotein translocase subunit SecE
MATVGKQPVTQPPAPKGRTAVAPPQKAAPRWLDRQRENIRNVIAELRKVTWPTREETRNLTIVVIGISVVLGTLLAGVDAILTLLYHAIP